MNQEYENIYFISAVNNYELYNKCIRNNPYVNNLQNVHIIDFDNTKENVYIPVRYNTFLNSYDYSTPAWFVFCHCDWELTDDISAKLLSLDKNCIYGPVGAKLERIGDIGCRRITGMCYERRRDGSCYRKFGALKDDKELTDTFDCQALIVHSSLIKKTNLRFDENLFWDLYVEDFCIQAKETFDIDSYAIKLNCCHWSGYHITPQSYYDSLKYINKKYHNRSYAGTISIIGDENLQEEYTYKNFVLAKLRQNIKKDLSNDKTISNSTGL